MDRQPCFWGIPKPGLSHFIHTEEGCCGKGSVTVISPIHLGQDVYSLTKCHSVWRGAAQEPHKSVGLWLLVCPTLGGVTVCCHVPAREQWHVHRPHYYFPGTFLRPRPGAFW